MEYEKVRKLGGYQGKYKISSKGYVVSVSRKVKMGNGMERDVAERVLKSRKNSSGVEVVDLYDGDRKVTRSLGKLIRETFK